MHSGNRFLLSCIFKNLRGNNPMKHMISSLLLVALLAPVAAMADQVRCESKSNALKECDMDTRGEVRMVKQLSRADCVEGRDWGVNRNSVWVKNGCRADFESGGSGYGGRSDWDRGCSDAKAGSYDRSGNASRSYEEGWQACKNQNHSSGSHGTDRRREASGNAESACMSAVNSRFDGRVTNLNVISSETSQANSTVILNADGQRWRCLVSNDGSAVEELSIQR
jgi:hypothetical protein